MSSDIFKTAPYNPPHLYRAGAVYMITSATYQKLPHLRADERKTHWTDAFHKAAEIYGWTIIAWVVLSNHYHVLVRAPETSADNLSKFVASYHKFTSKQWNDADRQRGRQVWWNYWDTCIRAEKDYLARLKYIYWNPVRHHIVTRPEDYAFSSYGAFLATQGEEVNKLATMPLADSFADVPDDF
jgi:putative transposase